MKKHKWTGHKLISGLLVMVMLAVAALAGLGAGSMAAASDPPPDVEWEKTFGHSNYEKAYSVQQTTDGGYIITGDTKSFSTDSEWHIYLVKTDAAGNMEWEQPLTGNPASFNGRGEQTTDGGYIIGGVVWSDSTYSQDFYLVKVDASGSLEWEKSFGGNNDEGCYAVHQATDGGYIMAGSTGSYGAGSYDVYLVKTDSLGNVEWEKTFGGIEWEEAYDAKQTADGGYIMAGYTAGYRCDFYLVKTDASGNLEWEQTIGGVEDELAYSIEQTADGGYIIAGETSSYGAGFYDFYLVKTDALGNAEWEQTFGGIDWDCARAVQQTTDGGYITAGYAGAAYDDAYLVKTDSLGNMEWEKVLGGGNPDCAHALLQTADGGYIVAGETSSYGAGLSDFYLVKISPSLNTPPGANVTVSTEDGTVTFPNVIEGGTTTMTTLTENPVDPTPADFYVIEGNFIEITTTASYSGLITVGLSYDESQVSNEESLRLFHWSDSAWQDATTFVDTVENIVYGEVSSLSPFFIGEPAVPPVADAGGPYLAQVGYGVDLDGSASYHPEGTIVSYDWSFGDNTTGSGVLVSHTYAEVGIYGVDLTVTDDKGLQASDTTMAVVYDPESGSATGGGWFWSAPGNLKTDPESEGKATFGFIVKYKQGAAAGNLEFQYHVGDINLKSTDMTWLVVSKVSAQFQGEGTINGEGLYTFRVLATDGDKTGGQPDEFTIRIWQGTDTESDPVYQAIHAQLGGGNIVIHN